MRFIIIIIISICLLSLPAHSQKLALVIVDGLAANSFHKFSSMSVFRTFEQEGVWSTKVLPQFPTYSLTNRHSLLTGVDARHHGLISQYVYNWRNGERFQNFTQDSDLMRNWWTIEPMYISAVKSKASVAMFYFPECRVRWDENIQVCVPPRNDGKSFSDDSQMKSILEATKEHDLILINHDEIGAEMKQRGVYSSNPRSLRSMKRFAHSLQRLIDSARERIDLDILVISTHGFIDVPRKNIRVLDEHIPMELIETTIGSGAIKQLVVNKGKTHQVYSQLKFNNPIPNVNVFYTSPMAENSPSHLNYKKSDIVADLVLFADPGYAVVTKDKTKQFPEPTLNEITSAIDGYNSELPDVSGILLAYGPSFKVGYRKGSIQLCDIYVLMCKMLSIDCNEQTIGRLRRIEDILTANSRSQINSTSSIATITSLLFVFINLFN